MLMLWCRTKVQSLFAERDQGATAAEYALIVMAITAAVAAVIFLFGDAIQDTFSEACTSIGDACSAGGNG